MKTFHYFGMEQKVFYEKLDNELDVYIVPNKNIKKFHIEMITKYGSDIEKVKLSDGTFLTIPHGSAHFLEHKVFDMEDESAISHFAKMGLYSNAGTNYFSTHYYVEGSKHFKDALEYLLKMIYTPYITDDTVNKEMGIIAEEIKMYDDEPFWLIDEQFRKCFYKNIMQDKIAGTEDDIHTITSDILNKVFDIFYQPSNMFMVISGNVEVKKILNILKENSYLNNHFIKKTIVYQEKKEPKEVVNEYYRMELNVSIPKFRYAFKFDLNDFKYHDKNILRYYLDLIFSVLFGDGSDFEEMVTEKKLVTYFFDDHFKKDNIYTLDFEGESEYADLFKEEVDKQLMNITINESDFERIKKVWYSLMIRSLDNPDAIAASLISNILLNHQYIDEKNIIDNLKYEDLKEIIKDLNFNNKTFVLVLPKE